MKLYCHPLELSEALNIVSKALPKNATIPITEGIKIAAFQNEITLSATDLEIHIEKKIRADVLVEGEIVVNGRFFVDFVRKLTDLSEIEINEIDHSKIAVKYLKNQSIVQCYVSETFPTINKVEEEVSFCIKQKNLKKVLEKTVFSTSTEDSRPILKGCFFEMEGDKINVVALDGHRLAMASCEISDVKGQRSIVINGKTLNEIVKIIQDKDDNIKINIQKNNILFDMDDTKVTTRLMEGEYINYNKVIPINYICDIVVNKKDFLGCLDRILVISKDQNQNYVKIAVESDKIRLSTSNQIGDINEEIIASVNGNPLDIPYNCRYLYDIFSRIEEENVRYKISGKNAPAAIEPLEGDAYRYIVLPVKMIG